MRDLEFTGCVDDVIYAKRPEPERETSHDSRKGLETDARVAVVLLNACTEPRSVSLTLAMHGVPPLDVRMIRRATLTARNHLIRDNLVWRTGDAARLSWHALKSWENERKNEQRIAREGEVLSAKRENAIPAGGL